MTQAEVRYKDGRMAVVSREEAERCWAAGECTIVRYLDRQRRLAVWGNPESKEDNFRYWWNNAVYPDRHDYLMRAGVVPAAPHAVKDWDQLEEDVRMKLRALASGGGNMSPLPTASNPAGNPAYEALTKNKQLSDLVVVDVEGFRVFTAPLGDAYDAIVTMHGTDTAFTDFYGGVAEVSQYGRKIGTLTLADISKIKSSNPAGNPGHITADLRRQILGLLDSLAEDESNAPLKYEPLRVALRNAGLDNEAERIDAIQEDEREHLRVLQDMRRLLG